jgi:GGDEF domain-containing protein
MSLSNSLRSTAAQTVRLLQLSAIPTTEDLKYIITTAKQSAKTVALPFKRDADSPLLVIKFTLPNKWVFERNDGSVIWTKESIDVLMIQNKVKIDSATTTIQNSSGAYQVYQPDASQSVAPQEPAAPPQPRVNVSSSSLPEMPFINLFAESVATEVQAPPPSSIPQQGFAERPVTEGSEAAVSAAGEVPADTDGEVFGAEWSGAQALAGESSNQAPTPHTDSGAFNLFGAFIPGAENSKPAPAQEQEAGEEIAEAHDPEVIAEAPTSNLEVENPIEAVKPEAVKPTEIVVPASAKSALEPVEELGEIEIPKSAEGETSLPAPVELDPYASEDIMIGLADPETRLTHFRAFTFFLQRELIRFEVAGAGLAIVSFDFSSKETSRTAVVSSECLDAISERLHELCSTLHICARMQTGQFVVLLSDSGIGSAIGFAEAMRDRFTEDPRLKKMCEGAGVLSIGIASASDTIRDAGVLLAAAIEAKNMSRASSLNYSIFS